MEIRALSRIKPGDLPAPPQTLMAMLAACAKETIDHKLIGDLATHDPLLSAELLRVVNSPLFGLERSIKNVTHAITLLGHRSLRNIILCLAVREFCARGKFPQKLLTHYWEQALRRAVAAKLLAAALHESAEESFTAGLMADMGLLALLHLHPGKTQDFDALLLMRPDQRLQEEKKRFGISHDEIGDMLAQHWKLPAVFVHAVGQHHFVDKHGGQPVLTRIVAVSDWIAVAINHTEWLQQCLQQIQALEVPRQQALETLCRLPEQVELAASALGLRIDAQSDLQEVLQQVNLTLAEENVSYQELTWQLQHTIRERDRLAEELERELQWAREIQHSLLPSNRDPSPHAELCLGATVAAKQLSGDFFDYFTLPNGKVYFNLADVSGKGVVAALLMAKTCGLFRCLGKRLDQPEALLRIINEEIFESTIRGMYVTMIAGLYDPSGGSLQIVNAGHPPAILMQRDGHIELFHAQCPPLGIAPELRPRSRSVRLDDASLICYSDGLVEGGEHKQFQLPGFVRFLHELREQPKQEKLDAIVSRWRTQQAAHDDMTVLLVQKS